MMGDGPAQPGEGGRGESVLPASPIAPTASGGMAAAWSRLTADTPGLPVAAVAILVVAGLLIGVIGSFSGAGGGFLFVPLLLGLGLRHTEAVGTTFVGIAVLSATALVAHLAWGIVHVPLGVCLGVGGLIGGQIGARLLRRISSRRFKQLFAGLLVLLAIYLVLLALDVPGLSTAAGTDFRPVPSPGDTDAWIGSLPFVAVGLGIGLAAAFAGLGGGILLVPLCLLCGYSPEAAVGTTFVAIPMIAISALVAHIGHGHVRWRYGISLAAGSVGGAFVGRQLLASVPTSAFKIFFAALLTYLAIRALRAAMRRPAPIHAPAAPPATSPRD